MVFALLKLHCLLLYMWFYFKVCCINMMPSHPDVISDFRFLLLFLLFALCK